MFKKIISIILFFALGVAIGLAIYLREAIYSPYDNTAGDNIVFIVKNVSINNLAESLKGAGLIKSPIAFELYVKYKKFKLIKGKYELSASMSIASIAGKIARGDIIEYKVTIPEGWRITQIAERLEGRDIVSKIDFEEAAKGQEGYLFPDTYYIKSGTSAKSIIEMMKANFRTRTKDITATPDVVILASIVEREVSKTDDRSQIAAVYANRLKIKMNLEADPTVQYAKGSWAAITQADYRNVISPYNTYLNNGLPPGPICNPGLASLQAAANPAKSDYLYFFHTHDGRTIFSKTLEEHNNNLAKNRAGTL